MQDALGKKIVEIIHFSANNIFYSIMLGKTYYMNLLITWLRKTSILE